MVSSSHDTKFGAMKNTCLVLPADARQCHTKKNKKARNYAGLEAFYAVSCLTMPDAGSLPLNRGRWLARHVIHHAIQTTNLVDDA